MPKEPALPPPSDWPKEDWMGRIDAAKKANEYGRRMREAARKRRRKIIVRPVPKPAP